MPDLGGPNFGPLCEILGIVLFKFGFISLPFLGKLMYGFWLDICKDV